MKILKTLALAAVLLTTTLTAGSSYYEFEKIAPPAALIKEFGTKKSYYDDYSKPAAANILIMARRAHNILRKRLDSPLYDINTGKAKGIFGVRRLGGFDGARAEQLTESFGSLSLQTFSSLGVDFSAQYGLSWSTFVPTLRTTARQFTKRDTENMILFLYGYSTDTAKGIIEPTLGINMHTATLKRRVAIQANTLSLLSCITPPSLLSRYNSGAALSSILSRSTFTNMVNPLKVKDYKYPAVANFIYGFATGDYNLVSETMANDERVKSLRATGEAYIKSHPKK